MDRAKSDPLATLDQECGLQVSVSEPVSRRVDGEKTDGAAMMRSRFVPREYGWPCRSCQLFPERAH